MDDRSSSYLDVALRERGITNASAARLCGTTPEAVRMWRLGERRPGVTYAKLLAGEYGIPRHLIRPDLWDPPEPVQIASNYSNPIPAQIPAAAKPPAAQLVAHRTLPGRGRRQITPS
jgi:hypothetical protein